MLNKYDQFMESVRCLAEALALTTRQIRLKSGLSFQKFADFAGLSKTYIFELESGTAKASLNAVYQLAAAAGMPPHEFVARIEVQRQRLMAAQADSV